MTNRIDTIQDLIRIISQDSGLRGELRRLLLTEEILDMPETLKQLVATSEINTEALRQQLQTLAQHTSTLARHSERFDQQSAVLAQHSERFDQQSAVLAQHSERFDQQSAVLAQHTSTLARHSERFDQQSAVLAQHSERFDQQSAVLADLKGDMAEIKGERPATGVVVPALNLRRIRIMLGTSQPAMSRQFREVVEQADEDGLLDGQELGRILDTDIVIRGARRDTGVRVYVPIEVTFKIDRDDIQRAEKSTEILGRLFPSDDVIGAVFGGEISEQDRAYAESRGIRVFLD